MTHTSPRFAVMVSAIVLSAVCILPGCAGASTSSDALAPVAVSPTPTPGAESSASSIADVWAILGCGIGKPDTLSKLSDEPDPIVQSGSCRPVPDQADAYFFEFSDDGTARDYFAAGKLNVSDVEWAYTSGRVIMITTDSITAMELQSHFELLKKGK